MRGCDVRDVERIDIRWLVNLHAQAVPCELKVALTDDAADGAIRQEVYMLIDDLSSFD